MSETFVVVGGDAAGMSAASKAKRENPEMDVIVFEQGEWVSYAACGMPYYLKGDIEDLEDLVAVPPETFRDERDIDLRTGHEVVGVGVEPNADLAAAAGIELGETGAVATDEYSRTNYENIYAAGDCAEARHVVTGEPDHVPLALTANRAGRAIGQTVVGDPEPVGGIAGTAIVKAFDLGAARTGVLDEERARDAGFDPVWDPVLTAAKVLDGEVAGE